MPFTIEKVPSAIHIVLMDSSGSDEDAELIIETAGKYEGYVSIRQYDDIHDRYEVISLSPSMFKDLIKSINSPIGFHGLDWK